MKNDNNKRNHKIVNVKNLTSYVEHRIKSQYNWMYEGSLPSDTQLENWKMKLNDLHGNEVIDEINDMVRIDNIVGYDDE